MTTLFRCAEFVFHPRNLFRITFVFVFMARFARLILEAMEEGRLALP